MELCARARLQEHSSASGFKCVCFNVQKSIYRKSGSTDSLSAYRFLPKVKLLILTKHGFCFGFF